MWKESYRLGVDLIDMQHMELFKMVGNLLDIVQNGRGDNKAECVRAISFLKDYTLQHFSDEEEYQKSIGYDGLRTHRMIHQKFVQDVLNHERKMIISDFNSKDVKDFMGTLISWLVYHVAGADQLIVSDKRYDEDSSKPQTPIEDLFYISTYDILNKIADLDTNDIKIIQRDVGDVYPAISVIMNMTGEISGTVTFQYTQLLAFSLIQSMASIYPDSIDELVCSAMLEISSIISVKAAGMITSRGLLCKLDEPIMQVHPAFLPSKKSSIIDTGIGILEMESDLKVILK